MCETVYGYRTITGFHNISKVFKMVLGHAQSENSITVFRHCCGSITDSVPYKLPVFYYYCNMFNNVRRFIRVQFIKVHRVRSFESQKGLHTKPNFTKNMYNVSRGNYNYLQESHIRYFENLLGNSRVIMDLCDLEKYNVDWYTQVREQNMYLTHTNQPYGDLTDYSCIPTMLHLSEVIDLESGVPNFGGEKPHIYLNLEKSNLVYGVNVSRALIDSRSSIVLKPKSTEEVSQILAFCNKNRLAICPQGGNTSVVGGSVPVFDEIIVSTELMNNIISLDETSGILVCQAGCILENLDDFLAENGLIVPLDLGCKGTCHIGGNVSTNAGGMRLLRYGNMHGNVLGLEVVKANGEVIDCLSILKKDNTGYHLKHLFIGSEGSLGFITKVSLHCPPRSKYRNVALLGLHDFDRVLQTFKKAKEQLAEILSAIDVMDAETMEFIKEKNNQQSPIGNHPFHLLIETSGSNEAHDSEKVNRFVEDLLHNSLVSDGTVASEPSKMETIWSIRENVSNGYKKCGAVFYYDISLPLEHYYTLVEDMRVHMNGKCERVFGYGHLGDGNIHLQIEMNEYNKDLKDHVEPYVFKRTAELKGSISAEHGLGFIKGKYLNMAKSPSSVTLMRELKKLLDPNGILNPYKVFPSY